MYTHDRFYSRFALLALAVAGLLLGLLASASGKSNATAKAPTATVLSGPAPPDPDNGQLPRRCQVAGAKCTIRNYYITAEEVIWDYAPSGRDNYHGAPIEQSTHASFYLSNGSGRIGRFNRKAIYRQYADANFTQRMEAPEWLGNLGPIIRAEVGDVVKVHFWNRAPGHDFSVHAHGVAYDRDSEGAAHAKGGAGSSVPPGARYTYLWDVSERAGPGPDDPSSILWFYHSHVDETADLYAGLMGPIIIYRAGHMPRKPQMDGRSHPFGTTLKAGGPDFDREFVVVFMANDENQSPYVRQNIAEFAHNSTSTTSVDYNLEDRSFREPNIKWTVNGRLYNNLPGLDTVVGERVRWYIAGFGEFYDVHSVHFHGATVLRAGQRTDVIQLVPAVFQQTDMVPDVTGTWLLHCHVNSHMMAGMTTYWNVYSDEASATAAARLHATAN